MAKILPSIRAMLRSAVRAVVPFRHNRPLSTDAARAEIVVMDPLPVMTTGQRTTLRVRVTNHTGWPLTSSGSYPILLCHRWESWSGTRYGEQNLHELSRTIGPAKSDELTVEVEAPEAVGDFVLDFDLLQRGLGRFTDHNLDPPHSRRRIPIHVTRPRDTDMNYHDLFRTADLSTNHWWVVGDFRSEQQFRRSALQRRDMLIRQFGLNPDSRILDVGCGTGQIAMVLDEYLSDRGAYFGTDLAREAIDFCCERFKRSNFVFRQNPMTEIPVSDDEGPFDLVLFFSVFTHTHIDEAMLLLAEATRLLAPSGKIIADFFVSPWVEREAGHRGAMDFNEAHFLRLAGLLGLEADIFARLGWSDYTERLMVRFTRK